LQNVIKYSILYIEGAKGRPETTNLKQGDVKMLSETQRLAIRAAAVKDAVRPDQVEDLVRARTMAAAMRSAMRAAAKKSRK